MRMSRAGRSAHVLYGPVNECKGDISTVARLGMVGNLDRNCRTSKPVAPRGNLCSAASGKYLLVGNAFAEFVVLPSFDSGIRGLGLHQPLNWTRLPLLSRLRIGLTGTFTSHLVLLLALRCN